jgi:hypothetical protein
VDDGAGGYPGGLVNLAKTSNLALTRTLDLATLFGDSKPTFGEADSDSLMISAEHSPWCGRRLF